MPSNVISIVGDLMGAMISTVFNRNLEFNEIGILIETS